MPMGEEASLEQLQVTDRLTLPRSAVSISDPDQARSLLMITHIVSLRVFNLISRAESEAQ